MKIIFLDIDGVLNCESAYRNGECQYQEWVWEDGRIDHYQKFCTRSKELLNKLIDETGAKIVISSTWRQSGIEFMKKIFQHLVCPLSLLQVFKENLYFPFRFSESVDASEVGGQFISWPLRDLRCYGVCLIAYSKGREAYFMPSKKNELPCFEKRF